MKRSVLQRSITWSMQKFSFIYAFLSDEKYLKLRHWAIFGKKLDLINPTLFNEKLQWLKIHDRKYEHVRMVDKYEAKHYVSETIGDEYVIPTLGVWDRFEDIDFNMLPEKFVLKCTHDSGGVCICKNKKLFDFKKAKKVLSRSLKHNYFLVDREWPYKKVKPRIIAEKYMEDSNLGELRDYKFFCFNGKAKCFKVDIDRFTHHRANYYDMNGEIMKLGEELYPPNFEISITLPENLKKMQELAEKLALNETFLRVDFYEVDGRVYFGELTFYPASGIGRFVYEDNDKMLGSWLNLPIDYE